MNGQLHNRAAFFVCLWLLCVPILIGLNRVALAGPDISRQILRFALVALLDF
jgi:hypothetical protein